MKSELYNSDCCLFVIFNVYVIESIDFRSKAYNFRVGTFFIRFLEGRVARFYDPLIVNFLKYA